MEFLINRDNCGIWSIYCINGDGAHSEADYHLSADGIQMTNTESEGWRYKNIPHEIFMEMRERLAAFVMKQLPPLKD